MHRYEVIIYWSAEDRVFVAEVPELPGCAVHGNTSAKALAEVQRAISLWLDTAHELGDPSPEPNGRRLQYA
jgi:predicted RNase H-like HicB family nuclease